MRCPNCNYDDSAVVETRTAEEGATLRRRRECKMCHGRFTTYERVEQTPIMVVKSNGTRTAYDQNKLLQGMIRACEKRPVALEALEEAAAQVSKQVRATGAHEIPSKYIGQLVMEQLKGIDRVAFIRFASVYLRFEEVDDFGRLVERLITHEQ